MSTPLDPQAQGLIDKAKSLPGGCGCLAAIAVILLLLGAGVGAFAMLTQNSNGDVVQLTEGERTCLDFAEANNPLHAMPSCAAFVGSIDVPTEAQCHSWVESNGMSPDELPACQQYLATAAPSAAPSAAPTSPPASAPTAPPLATATPGAPTSSRIAPATNVQVSTDDPQYLLIEWEYKEEWEVAPDHFEILFDGEVVNTGSPYEGLDWEYGYSWISDVGCGVSHQVVVAAVNGEDVARAEPVEGHTTAC